MLIKNWVLLYTATIIRVRRSLLTVKNGGTAILVPSSLIVVSHII